MDRQELAVGLFVFFGLLTPCMIYGFFPTDAFMFQIWIFGSFFGILTYAVYQYRKMTKDLV